MNYVEEYACRLSLGTDHVDNQAPDSCFPGSPRTATGGVAKHYTLLSVAVDNTSTEACFQLWMQDMKPGASFATNHGLAEAEVPILWRKFGTDCKEKPVSTGWKCFSTYLTTHLDDIATNGKWKRKDILNVADSRVSRLCQRGGKSVQIQREWLSTNKSKLQIRQLRRALAQSWKQLDELHSRILNCDMYF